MSLIYSFVFTIIVLFDFLNCKEIGGTTENSINSLNATLNRTKLSIPIKQDNEKSSLLNKESTLNQTTQQISSEWGGNCTETNWKACCSLKTYFGAYADPKDPNKKKIKYHEIDCKLQPILCLKNGWTVTRCQILCMGNCNRDMLSKYDEYVVKEGQC